MKTQDSYRQDFSVFSKAFHGKKILLTGGSGFFGKNLLEVFRYGNVELNWQCELTTVSRGEMAPNVEFSHCHVIHDLTKPFLNQMPENVDLIIHAASPLNQGGESPTQVQEAMVASMENVLQYAEAASAKKVLFTSSGAVYGPQPTGVSHISEEYSGTPPSSDPKWAYGNAKKEAEEMGMSAAKKNDFQFTVARCFALSGRHLPLDRHFALGNFVGNLLRDEPIAVNGDPRTLRSYLDAEDLSFWLFKILLEGKNGEAYHVGSDEAISMGDLAKLVDSFREKSSVQIATGQNSNAVSTYVPSIQKAKSELGLEMKTSLRDSIEKMIGFYHA